MEMTYEEGTGGLDEEIKLASRMNQSLDDKNIKASDGSPLRENNLSPQTEDFEFLLSNLDKAMKVG